MSKLVSKCNIGGKFSMTSTTTADGSDTQIVNANCNIAKLEVTSEVDTEEDITNIGFVADIETSARIEGTDEPCVVNESMEGHFRMSPKELSMGMKRGNENLDMSISSDCKNIIKFLKSTSFTLTNDSGETIDVTINYCVDGKNVFEM